MGNIQELFSDDARIAVCDPVYPVYVDSNETADRLLMNTPDNREELERYLERKTGRHVEVEMHLAAQRGPELRNVDIDGMMRSRIHMDIEELEDDDTEDEPF